METPLKTFQHWADTHLNKEDSDKFFVNMANEENANTPTMEVQEHDFIYSAFVWDKSNEGHFYWENIQKDLEDKNEWPR